MMEIKKHILFNAGSSRAPYAAKVRKGDTLICFTADSGRELLKLVRKYKDKYQTSLYKQGHLVATCIYGNWIY